MTRPSSRGIPSVSKYAGDTTAESIARPISSGDCWCPGTAMLLWPKFSEKGIREPRATDTTPGIARSRSSASRKNCAARASSYRTMPRSSPTMARPSARKPTLACSAALTLRRSSPADTSSNAVTATCAITSRSRIATRRPPTRPATTSAFRSGTRSCRDARRAGTSPAMIPVSAAAVAVNASTRQSSDTSSASGTGIGRLTLLMARVSHHANATPAAAPRPASTTASVSNCCTSRARLAPTAMRTAISFCRADARASSMPATFAHAMRSTRPTAPIVPMTAHEIRPSASGCTRTSVVGSAAMVRSRLVTGCSAASWAATTSRLACACAGVTPGLRRPLRNSQRCPRRSRRLVPVGEGTALWMPAGSTSSWWAVAMNTSGERVCTMPV